MKTKVNSTAPAQSFMTIPEVQSFLGIKSRKTILKYITSGKLSAYKVGGTRWRIAAPDVMAFLKAEFNAIGKEKPKKKFVIQPLQSSSKTKQKLSSPNDSVGDLGFTLDSRLKHAGMTKGAHGDRLQVKIKKAGITA